MIANEVADVQAERIAALEGMIGEFRKVLLCAVGVPDELAVLIAVRGAGKTMMESEEDGPRSAEEKTAHLAGLAMLSLLIRSHPDYKPEEGTT